MTGLRRTMGFVCALAALQAPLWARPADELSDTFNQGVEMWQRGHEKEALDLFAKVLASSPTQESAYELWKNTDYTVWRELLTAGGQAELVARRVIELARAGRKALANDEAAITALVSKVIGASDPLESRAALRQLSSDHGEYAVPYLIGFLGSGMSDQEKTVRAMDALVRMETDVVVPLCTALDSSDAVLRRNTCYVLGTIGDRRSAGFLQWHAQGDSDASVKSAAADAITRARFKGDALSSFLAMGEAYHQGSDLAIRDNEHSDVTWSWIEPKLVATPIPRAIYNDELSRIAYDHALTVNPGSNDALAGLARSYVGQMSKLEILEKSGQDLGAWKSRIDEARLAVNVAGVSAVDTALAWSVKGSESSTGAALCRTLAGLAKEPTPGLNAALHSTDGALRSEAAVALASIAQRAGQSPGSETVALLGEAVGREVVRVAFVVDPNESRARQLQAGLEHMGMFVTRVTSGAQSLALIRRAAGVDVALFADVQSDVTLAQMLDEVKEDPRLATIPVVVITDNAEQAAATYGDRIAGTTKSADDLKAVEAALAKEVGGDRALADDLAARAAMTLTQLGRSGRADVSPVAGSLVRAIANRPDNVSIAALEALGSAGGAAQAAAIVAVIADTARTEPVRIAAADALASILGRDGAAVSSESAQTLKAVAVSDAGVKIRDAVARAIGLVQIDANQRIDVLRKLKGGAGEGGAGGGS